MNETAFLRFALKQHIAPMVFLIVALWGCSSDTAGGVERTGYIENALSFYDPCDKDYTRSSWIRDPKNILVTHETLKKIGYERVFDAYDTTPDWCWIVGEVNKPCIEIMDSLLITYAADSIPSAYYREFWERRKREGNEAVVYSVLSEIQATLRGGEEVELRPDLVNDTLYQAVEIRAFGNALSAGEVRAGFHFLVDMGLHQSAFNLLCENRVFAEMNWNRNELLKLLEVDTAAHCAWPWIEDTSK